MNINYNQILNNYENILYKEYGEWSNRPEQLQQVVNILQEHFDFDKVVCLETGASQNWKDGCVGYFLCKLVEESKGKFVSVDNNKDVHDKSVRLYNHYFKDLDIENYLIDSVKYIEETNINFNLIHLDSWDLNLDNPLPSMLHCWREFQGLKDKVSVGTIIIIDDNFFKGTWVKWNYPNGESKIIDITYPIIGKGGLIYHFCKNEDNGWKILSKSRVGKNNKIVIKKIK